MAAQGHTVKSPETQAWMAMMWRAGMTQKEIGRVLGDHGSSLVCVEIKAFCETWTGRDVQQEMLYSNDRKQIVGNAIKNYLKLYSNIPPPAYQPPNTYPHWMAAALDEHAWMLRAEGRTFRDIGDRLGVSPTRAKQRIANFGRRTQRAMRKCRVKWKPDDVA
jgi:hypothetical protein